MERWYPYSGIAMYGPAPSSRSRSTHRSPTTGIELLIINQGDTRNETPIEAYWTWTFFGGLLLTPGVQYINHPALNPTQGGSWVAELRLTQLF